MEEITKAWEPQQHQTRACVTDLNAWRKLRKGNHLGGHETVRFDTHPFAGRGTRVADVLGLRAKCDFDAQSEHRSKTRQSASSGSQADSPQARLATVRSIVPIRSSFEGWNPPPAA